MKSAALATECGHNDLILNQSAWTKSLRMWSSHIHNVETLQWRLSLNLTPMFNVWFITLPRYLLWIPESKVTLDGRSQVTGAREIDLADLLALIYSLGSIFLGSAILGHLRCRHPRQRWWQCINVQMHDGALPDYYVWKSIKERSLFLYRSTHSYSINTVSGVFSLLLYFPFISKSWNEPYPSTHSYSINSASVI